MLAGQVDAFVSLIETLTSVEQIIKAMELVLKFPVDGQTQLLNSCMKAFGRVSKKVINSL